MSFPQTRMRRLRGSASLRALVQETRVDVGDLIAPLFLVPGSRIKNEITAMPGQFHLSIDTATEYASTLAELGVKSVLLFGIPDQKDQIGSSSWNPKGIIPETVRALKRALPELVVITDLCFCEYTSHGHCGVMKDGRLSNDESLENLNKQALVHAEAGADILAPSGMLDGMILSLREALDDNKFDSTCLMSYAAKFSSSFYGPFREAVQSAPEYGDRKSYQMDYSNGREAIREVALDLEEGADIVMVKPALSFLDIIKDVKDSFGVPTAAYNVSGEYSMVKAAAKLGMIDGQQVMLEIMTSIKRAGADMIITYFAEEFAKLARRY